MQTGLIIKLAIIIALILFLMLPLTMIHGVISERNGYRFQVEQDIAETWTANQLIIGPVLSVPYEVKFKEKVWDQKLVEYKTVQATRWLTKYFVPQRLTIDGVVKTEQRSRGIYSVPVYSSDFSFEGEFSAAELEEFRKEVKGFEKWGQPRFSLAIGDVRGIGANPKLLWSDTAVGFEAGTALSSLSEGIQALLPVPTIDDKMSFSVVLELRGSRDLRLAPVSKETTTKLQSPWPHPKFVGRFLPVQRDVTAQGFTATWQTSSFSTNVETHLLACVTGECSTLSQTAYGVQFFESMDVYQKVTRATKYGILFILLTFVAFFLTETLIGKPLHPVQYVLVGFALCIFYLLLISLSEHYGFAASYGIATASCVVLIGLYLTGVLGSAWQGFSYATGISLLYAMLFVILRSEDFALLMGALLLFAMLAAVMLMTRRVNWYRVGEKIEARMPGSPVDTAESG